MDEEAGDPRIKQHKKRYDALLSSDERGHFESHWEEIAELVSPRKTGFRGSRTSGEKKMARVFDPTAIHANDLLAAGMHGMATNPAAKWFSLRLVADELNDDMEVMEYLATVEDRMWAEIYSPGTQLTTALHECYHDLGSFGTGCIFVGERDDGKILFQSRTLSEILIAENADGIVDTVYRCTEYTVVQLMELADRNDGWLPPSEKVQEKYRDGKWDDKVKVVHVIGRRRVRDYNRKDVKNKEFESLYFEWEAAHLLKEGGVDEFPYLTPRWQKLANEIYGRSPAMTALPDVKMLQQMTLSLIKAAQKATDPPLFLPSDGTFGKQIRIVPGGVNFYKGRGQDIVTMPTPDKLPITMEIMEQVRNRIRTTFYVDVLQMFAPDAKMTATEVMQRTQERMRLMGPIIGRLEAEMLGPLITRVYGILERQGKFDDLEVPEALSGHEWTVEYVSPIATAQKQTEAEGFAHVVQMFGVFGEQGLMELAKRVDFDRAAKYGWDLFNVEPSLLMTDEGMEERKQQEQSMMATEQAPKVAGAAAQGAKAMKDLGDAQNAGGIDINQLMQMAGQAPQQAAEAQAPADMGGGASVDDILAQMEGQAA